jgi:hypothetical protein
MVLSRPATAVAAFAILVTCAVVEVARADPSPILLWERHPGTAMVDAAWAVATDAAGNVVVAGHTYGSMARANKGHDDAFVIKYSPDGTPMWRRQLGSWNRDSAFGVASDSSGNIIMVALPGARLYNPRRVALTASSSSTQLMVRCSGGARSVQRKMMLLSPLPPTRKTTSSSLALRTVTRSSSSTQRTALCCGSAGWQRRNMMLLMELRPMPRATASLSA